MFRYWIKVLQLTESSVVKHVFIMLKQVREMGQKLNNAAIALC